MAMADLKKRMTKSLVLEQLDAYADGLLWLLDAGSYRAGAQLNPYVYRQGSVLWNLADAGLVTSELGSEVEHIKNAKHYIEYHSYTLTKEGRELAEGLRRGLGPEEYKKRIGGIDAFSIFPIPAAGRKAGF